MSDRRRNSWEKKEEKMHPAEIHSNVSHGSSPKWSNSEVNDGMMPDNFSGRQSWDHLNEKRDNRDRYRMQTYLPFSEREQQYRTRDRRGGGSAPMSRDRDRTTSPEQSRSRSNGRGGVRVRGVSRSRSRSRSRDWESSRARSRSPYYDGRRESNAYMNVRNNSRISSRRPDYTGGSSRYDDYERDDRNVYDDRSQRHQSTRSSRIPCRFFAAGNCYRDNCKFSHDDINPSNISKSSFVKKEKKPWNGPLWADVEPRGFNEMSHDENKNRTSWDFPDAGKPNTNPNLDNKKGSWNAPSWADVEPRDFNEKSRDESYGHTSDDKKITSWDFPDVGKPKSNPNLDDKNRTSWDFPDVGELKSNPNFDGENRTSWDLPDVGILKSNSNLDENRTWNGPSWGEVSSSGLSNLSKPIMNAKIGNNVDGKAKKWNDPLWDEVGELGHSDVRKASGGDGSMADVPRDNEIVVNNFDLNNDNSVTEDDHQQILTFEKGFIQGSIRDVNSQSLCFNGTENSQHTVLLNPFSGPNISLNGLVQDGEKPLELDVPQAINDPKVNTLPEPLPEISQKQLPQLYTEQTLANAIDFLRSLPNSACNQDTIPKEQPDSAVNMEVKIGVGKAEGNESIAAEHANKQEQENMNPEGKSDEGDEKAMRQFKVALVEFVKEILKPKWKEGKLSREVHKTVVKKVIEKITSTFQGIQIPRTQSKIEQYLSYSKPKITKLVEAYVEKFLKA